MEKNRAILFLTVIVLFILLLFSFILFPLQHYLVLSVAIIGMISLLFFKRFERKKVKAREIVILAMLAAIAAIARVPFAGLPSIQPTSFVIITVGLVFGAESGFLVGAVAAIVSNIFLGQGPWTPWQMFAWGTMGLSAGLLRPLLGKIWIQCIFGFVWGFLFGWIMNLWIIVSNMENFSWEVFIGVYASSFSHDLSHAICNVIFIALFSKRWVKILDRFKRKYGLLGGSVGDEGSV
ncbi:ECF transporter S component [Paucisalibacillus sp. EB02]|uniref:ECF transporter S component n=1 Tax=Paucisalibacillus sp. EB02 TaxID=1347087 RepID=UPI0004B1F862|nr:ECF transporter S component [Paucisalibacillus sp. EB02]